MLFVISIAEVQPHRLVTQRMSRGKMAWMATKVRGSAREHLLQSTSLTGAWSCLRLASLGGARKNKAPSQQVAGQITVAQSIGMKLRLHITKSQPQTPCCSIPRREDHDG